MKSMIAIAVVSCLGCGQDGNAEVIQQLRNTQAVQQVQLDDARARIHALEMDMDQLAPHTIPTK